MDVNLFSYSWNAKNQTPGLHLGNGSRVAVIGGGPAGSFFSYFLLDLAGKVGIDLQVNIYEPRDFSLPAPRGCNMCAGVISETLVQNLATEGINFPDAVIQKAINSYVLHTHEGSQQIDAAFFEKRIGAAFRGGGPNGVMQNRFQGFDGYMLSLARSKGANLIPVRVTGVEKVDGYVQIQPYCTPSKGYDLVAVAAGVNTALLKLFDEGDTKYRSPQTTRTAIREYFLGQENVKKAFGDSLHVFLLDIPRLEFGMIIPKGDHVSVCLLGKDIDGALTEAFMTAPEVRDCFPPGWLWNQPVCQCFPRVNIRSARHPYADRLVFIGDSGVTRLYKDGIGGAYRAAKAAAACAIFEGVSSEDFRRFYAPYCQKTAFDNQFGKVIFYITHLIQHKRFARKGLLKTIGSEQLPDGKSQRMSSVLWDTFTGSAPYQEVFLRTLHPAFASRFIRNLASSFFRG